MITAISCRRRHNPDADPGAVKLHQHTAKMYPPDAVSLANEEPPAPLSPDLVRGSGRRPIDPAVSTSLATGPATRPIPRGKREPSPAYVAWLNLLVESAKRAPVTVPIEQFSVETNLDIRGSGVRPAPHFNRLPGVRLTASPVTGGDAERKPSVSHHSLDPEREERRAAAAELLAVTENDAA